MGGYGSGRYRVLTDEQREQRMKEAGRKWREEDPVRYAAYMREYRKKNYERTLELDRESKQRKKLRMIEDAFERSLDRQDGFEIVSYNYRKNNKQKERKRKKNLERYYKKRDEILAKLRAKKKVRTPESIEYHKRKSREHYLKNKETILAKLKKTKAPTPCAQSLSIL